MKYLSTAAFFAAALGLAACENMSTTTVTTPSGSTTTTAPAGSTTVVTTDASPTAQATSETPVVTVKSGGKLGTSVASLGDPAQGGNWVKTSLVKAPTKGRVTVAGGSKSVNVDLLPGTGATQMSLSAMRALGVDITELPSVDLYAL
ncbi:hypothetical protein [Paracoccus pacificus]|uniref:Uncharacterized protein n=1 Tax=Paracoccus pacificus TaxID=1463598 RepID=A0ABW4R581_9RHOB